MSGKDFEVLKKSRESLKSLHVYFSMTDLWDKVEIDQFYDCFGANPFDADQIQYIYHHEKSF